MDRERSRKPNGSNHGLFAAPVPTQNPQSKKSSGGGGGHRRSSKYQLQSSLAMQYDPFNCSPSARLPVGYQPQCHYSLPVGFSLEPVYHTMYPPVEPVTKLTKPKTVRKSRMHGRGDVPAMLGSPRHLEPSLQDYASLPPATYDTYSKKSSDTEGNSRRRFSDPGLGQMSSDECCSTRSEGDSRGSSVSSETTGVHSNVLTPISDQLSELRDNNRKLSAELQQTKADLENLKMLWNMEYQPGKLTDVIAELREATRKRDEAVYSKVMLMLQENSQRCREVHQSLEKNYNRTELMARLESLERRFDGVDRSRPKELAKEDEEEDESKEAMEQQIVGLEQEKMELRRELQEAVASRKDAEATTQRLERLVGILRKKINGVSVDTCLTDEKQNKIRPLSATFEQNPFIIANIKGTTTKAQHGQKHNRLEAEDPADDDDDDSKGRRFKEPLSSSSSGGSSSTGTPVLSPVDTTAPRTAQVTITGPVTDL